MSDYIFEKVIIAYTAGELLDQLEDTSEETVIGTEGGLWAGVSRFSAKTETFTDAFDHTVYQHVIYEPVNDGGEACFMLRRQAAGPEGYRLVTTAGELKQYLKDTVPAETKAVAVDDNFELGGAITESVKLVILRNETGRIISF